MPRKKSFRIQEIKNFSNVANGTTKQIQKKLASFLQGKKKTIIEIGCGNGEYSLALAKLFPERNIIGIDRKAERIWKSATMATKQKLENAFFINSKVEFFELLFGENKAEEIWITFPDPYLKKPDRRLTAPIFLKKYKKILRLGGILHLKTDEQRLHDYSLAVLKKEEFQIIFQTKDLYRSKLKNNKISSISTYYEKKHISEGNTICYLKAKSLFKKSLS